MLLRGGRSAATEGGKRIAGLVLEQIGDRLLERRLGFLRVCVFRERKKKVGRPPLKKPTHTKSLGKLPQPPSKFYLLTKTPP